MRYMIHAMMTVLIISFVGCAQPRWKHPTKSQVEFKKDYEECKDRAQFAVSKQKRLSSRDVSPEVKEMKLIEDCMRRKGYYIERE